MKRNQEEFIKPDAITSKHEIHPDSTCATNLPNQHFYAMNLEIVEYNLQPAFSPSSFAICIEKKIEVIKIMFEGT